MKKTLIALMALAGSAMSQDAITLRYLLEFNNNDGSATNTAQSKGETPISQNGYVNWGNPGSLMDGSTNAHPSSKAENWSITSGTGIGNGDKGVLSTDTGFTITFNGYAASGVNWKDFISFTVGNESYKFELNDGSALNIYTATTQASTAAQISNVEKGKWYNYAVSVLGDNYTFSVFDITGTLVSSSQTFKGATGNLTGVYDVSSFEPHTTSFEDKTKQYFTDNIAIYDGALSTKLISQLIKEQVAGKGTPQSFAVVPEPTTATLSLLALAGLAARRRRK